MKLKLGKGELLSKGEAELESRSKCALILGVHVCVEFVARFWSREMQGWLLGEETGSCSLLDRAHFRWLQG